MNKICADELSYLEKEYFQNKAILFFGLFLFLSHSVLAELSDSRKIKFVKQLAQPFSEKKVFYRWVSEESWKMLIEAGEWTPELYEHYMGISREQSFGSGFYVSEHISTGYIPDSGNALIQVEMELDDPGDSNNKYLDLSQKKIQNALKEQNIDIQQLLDSRFNLQIAIKYSSAGYDKWVLKGQKGVRFKPFSSEDMSLYTLEENYRNLSFDRQRFLEDSIRKDILSREQRDSAILSSPFIGLIEEALGIVYVSTAIYDAINSPDFRLETMGDAVRWLKNIRRYLSVQEEEKLAKAAKDLPIKDTEEAIEFLIFTSKYLSGAEIKRIVLRTPTRSVVEVELLRSWLPSSRLCYNSLVPPRSF